MSAINVSNLSKAYKQYSSKWARFAEWVVPFFGSRHKLKWVLKDISFSVMPGEALGIIGINGAGKSTLLKMITGTVKSTTGKVVIHGKVAALLELGMGFHPDFTGRQNVYMAGQLLGYSAGEITALMPEIESFAEIGDYIDRPVRIYSSGMQMRLAFSVATARRPDVLIIDEALSVGDAYFQHKSFDRIRQFRKLGSTLLMVSHDKSAIQSICDKAILLDGGQLRLEGLPEDVMNFYNAMLSDSDATTVKQLSTGVDRVQTVSGSGTVKITSVVILNENGEEVKLVGVGQKIYLKIDAVANTCVEDLVIGYSIKDKHGQDIFGTNSFHHDVELPKLKPGQAIEFVSSFFANVGEGHYSISVALHRGENHIAENYEWRDLASIFEVKNLGHKRFIGASWIEPKIEVHI